MDEVDKLGRDFRGDPASALLEVLDPEQNNEFRDHYLDIAFDLSEVLFITTANELEPIPGPLRDRMEIIHLSGYTEQEKAIIAKQYLVPRQIRENGLRSEEIEFAEEAILEIVRNYTREAGVRTLEREIGRAARKVVTKIAEGLTEKVYILAGVTPLKSAGMAKFMARKVAGMEVPESVIRRMASVPQKKAGELGIEICLETLAELQTIDGVSGIHIMAIEWEEKVAEIVERAGLKH